MSISVKQIFDKIGYGDYGEFSVEETDEYIKVNTKEKVDMVFWSVVLNPEFCKKVFGEKDLYFCENCHNFVKDELDMWGDGDISIGCKFCQDESFYQNIRYLKRWENYQEDILYMRNQNKSIEEVLKYIEQNTILDLYAT